MADPLTYLGTVCGSCYARCGCPEVHLASDAAPEQQVVITDNLGQLIQMSAMHFAGLVEKAQPGGFDLVIHPAR
ncbi:hypothetical protein E1292_41675 [Nonomuraea deserti]|uniref:Uncharacterized protein n=1 Tax=Nonomuraea deserti TaxID=1848322 RepID=A0A4R4UKI4_9ACTN|nr:hypothetical protein [Nonomuraea deserti]TDC92487.1 hypothetical protein E1292_41675 [Nonomuraea deserti]